MSSLSSTVVEEFLKPMLLKDLRIQCRARGLNPGGGKETLMERLKESMIESGNMSLAIEENGVFVLQQSTGINKLDSDANVGFKKNNYVRPEGQNVGNFLTERPSSRVLAPPGGRTSVFMGDDMPSHPTHAGTENLRQHSPPPAAYNTVEEARAHETYTAGATTYEAFKEENPQYAHESSAPPATAPGAKGSPVRNNNYVRPAGQNAGNFLTEKPTSRVLAPPGGTTSIFMG